MLGISKNMTRLRQLYEMRKSLLGNTSFISEEQKQEFMDLIKEIDSVEQKDYLVLLASKTYSTTNNSDELKRLKELVELIDERYKSRQEMVDDFKRIFRSNIEFDDDIKEYSKVDIYRQKITYLESITNNEHTIEDNKKLINDLSVELSKEYDRKKENNRVNRKLEEELLNKITIKTNLAGNNAYDLVSVIDMELSKFRLKMSDLLENNSLLKEKMGTAKEESSKAKEKYHTALISYNANILENYRVLGEIKKEYYTCRYYEILLGICALVIPLKESDYDNLVGKRYRLIKLLDERKSLRNELEIRTYDRLSNLYNEVNEQCKRLLEQGNNIDNIDDLEHRIAVLTNQIDDLEKNNQELINNIKNLDQELTNEKPKVKVSNMRPEDNMVIAVESIPKQMKIGIINFKTRKVLATVYELLLNKNKEQEKVIPEPIQIQEEVQEEPILPKFDLPIIDSVKQDEPIEENKEPVVEDDIPFEIPMVDSVEEKSPTSEEYVNPEITIEEVEKNEPIQEPVIIKGEPILSEEKDIFEDDNTPMLKEEEAPIVIPEVKDAVQENEPINTDLFTNDKDEDKIDVGMIFPKDNSSIDNNLFWPQIEMPEVTKHEESKIDLEKTQELSLDEQVERFLKSSD